MADLPVSRGKFLRSLGSTVTGMALGTGMAVAAQVLARTGAANKAAPPALEPVKEEPVHFFENGPSDTKQIALTFDDGPTPGVTERILDELRQRNLSATFFMVGERVAAAPDLARRVLAEGHEIGNHTYTHPNLTTLPDLQVAAEIRKTQEIIGHVAKYQPLWFRPPYGSLRKNQTALLKQENLGIVRWSVDPRDWAQPGETKIKELILKETGPGSIILCHDLHLQTAQAIGLVLDGLLELHHKFVTISLLLDRHHLVH